MQSPHLNVDDSILNYLRTSTDEDALVLLTDMVPASGQPEDKPEEEYAKRLYLAIRFLKDEYLAMAKGDNIDQYLTNLTYRQLVPFKDYLGYIQATNTNSNPEYKHSIALLSDLTTAGGNFQTITNNAVTCSGDKGDAVKTLKLNKGVDSQLPTVKDLKEYISFLKKERTELIDAKAAALEMALEEFDAQSGLVTGEISYSLQVGDDLTSIAIRFGTSVAAILNSNEYPGPAIQSLTVLIPGENISIPVEQNSTALASLQRQKTELKSGLEKTYTKTIEGIDNEIGIQEGYLEDLLKGIVPNASIANDSMDALYRPYDEHRRAHILIAFQELIYSSDSVKVTK
jgi:LysM repeat protein